MVVNDRLGPGLAAPVDDRCMVQRVGQDHLAATGQGGDHARVGQEARAEHHARFVTLELGEFVFDLAVQGGVARHETGGTDARSPSLGRFGGCRPHRGVGRQAEVIVGA